MHLDCQVAAKGEKKKDKKKKKKDESEEEEDLTPEQKKAKDRKALLDRLAREYEESVLEAKAAAEDGTGCASCSS